MSFDMVEPRVNNASWHSQQADLSKQYHLVELEPTKQRDMVMIKCLIITNLPLHYPLFTKTFTF